MRCPKCKNQVLQKSGATTTLRTEGRLTFNDSGVCLAKCFWCKEPVEIPIQIKDDVPISEERFYVSRRSGQ